MAATLDASSGGPITCFGVGNPYDATKYHSYYVCVSNCTQYNPATGVDPDGTDVYVLSERGGYGEMPWTYDLGTSVTYLRSFGDKDLRVKFAIYNLLNQQREVRVDQELQPSVGMDGDHYLVFEQMFGPSGGDRETDRR